MSVTFTENQLSAIYTKNTDILVAAAAGSGKTAVLVERIIQNILSKMRGEDGLEIDELLVATFTNASARDMKDKIERALRQRLAESDDMASRAFLNEQLLKMNKAHISTLHSFCLYLVQNHYQIVGLSPNVRTVDSIEGELLLEQVIKTTIERQLKTDDEAFRQLTQVFLGNNNIDAFVEIVKSAYRSAIANADVDTFLNDMRDEYVNDAFLDDLKWKYFNHLQNLVNDIESSLKRVHHHLDDPMIAADYEDQKKKATYTRVMKKIHTMSEEIIGIRAELEREEPTLKKLTEFTATDMKNFENFIDPAHDSKAIITSTAELYSKLIGTYTSSLIQSTNDYRDDLRGMNDMRNAFIDLVLTVKKQFIKQKRAMGVIDFNDYEHLALEILEDDGVRGTYQEKFKEIMIDEYQDTNPAQEAIVSRLKSPTGENHLFMVGDVKQSIYKFRQADPTIFIDKFKRYQASDDGTLITLNNNFRSSYGVINMTNRVFERIMDEAVGDVTYDETQALVYSKQSDNQEDTHAYVENYTETSEIPHFKDRYVVERIKSLKAAGEKFKDIVLLTRTKTQHIDLQQLLFEHNIPSHIESDRGYFESTEIRTIKSILNIIDNPLQDDHVVGVLRLPYFDFNVNEISIIRNASERPYLHEAIVEYIAHHDDELAQRLQRFKELLEHFREESDYVSVHELIEMVYGELRLIEFFSAMYNGEVRKANLHQFQHKARMFEQQRHITLYEFLSYINELLSEEKDFGETSVLSEEDDVVRIMTIHKSKGLEFKNVLYYHLDKNIENPMRKEPSIHLHSTQGLSMKTFDTNNHTVLRNMHSVMVSDLMKQELYSEEIRLMYVAFTRAEERLILPLNHTKEQSNKYNISSDSGVIERNIRLNLSSFKDYLTPIGEYLNHMDSRHEVKEGIVVQPQLDMDTFTDDETDEQRQTSKEILDDIVESLPQIESDDELRKRIMYAYESPNDLDKKVFKESVTEIKRRHEVIPDEAAPRHFHQTSVLPTPKFIEEKLTASVLGTWMHEWMMLVIKSIDDVQIAEDKAAYLTSLFCEYGLSERVPEQRHLQFVNNALKFITDETVKHLLDNCRAIYTERPFIMNQRAIGEDVVPEQMVQGIIDLIIETDDGYTIIDYKTDYIDENQGESELVERYHKQLSLYTKALEKATGALGNIDAYLYYFNWKGGAIKVNV